MGSWSREKSRSSERLTIAIRCRKRGTRRNFCARSRICVHAQIFSAAFFACGAGSRLPFTSFSRNAVSFTFIRRSSPAAIAKARENCFVFPRSTSKIRRGKTGRDRFRAGFFRPPDLSDRQRTTGSGSVRLRACPTFTPSARHFGPKTQTRPAMPVSSG